MNKAFFLMGLVVLTFVFCPGYSHEEGFYPISKAEAETGTSVGQEMPAFTAISLEGEHVKLGETGVPYVLNFWATWCPPCRAEFPEINAFANEHGADVHFYAINIEEPIDTIRVFLGKNEYSLPVLLDPIGRIAQIFRIRAVPTTIVVDSQGIIQYRKSGGATKDELEKVLNSL